MTSKGWKVDSDGYIRIRKPEHPAANANGYVLEHRMVMWDAGLLTDLDHVVHHINGDRQDNRVENLVVTTFKDHIHDHHRPTHCKRGHEFTEENTYVTSRGRRHCRTCDARRHRRYRKTAKNVVSCGICGKDVRRTTGQLNRTGGNAYCSMECSVKNMQRHRWPQTNEEEP